jgi:hypothetical protein
MKFVREASQRRSASHTHKHDPDTHGDQSRSLIIQPELTSKTVLDTSESHRDEITPRLRGDCKIQEHMFDLLYRMSFFTATPCCPNHPVTQSHAVGIWAEPLDLCAHPVGLTSGEQRWEIRFFCSSDPEKMAMAARHAEGQRTYEVCRPQQWVPYSLTAWIWVQLVLFFRPCKGLEKGFQHLQRFRPHANGGGVTSQGHCGGAD